MRKKGLWIGLLVLLLGVLCALFLPVDVLPLEDVSADMTFDADGNVYMTANDGAHSRILSADREGRVLYCYEEDSSADGRVSAVGPVAVADGRIYFIRRYGNGRLASMDGWELVQLDMASGETALLYSDHMGDARVTDLSVSGGMLYLTCVGKGSKAGEQIDTLALYRLDLEKGEREMLSVAAADVPAGGKVLTAVYGGGDTMCALRSDGTLIRTSGLSVEEISVSEDSAPVSGLYASDGYLWARGAQKGDFLTGTASRLREREMSETVLSGAATASQLVIRVCTEEGRVALARSEGEDVSLIERLEVPLSIRFQLRWPVMAMTAVIMLAVLLLAAFVYRTIQQHRLRNRMTVAAIGLSALFFAAMTLLCVGAIFRLNNVKNEENASWHAQNAAAVLQRNGLTNSNETQELMEGMLDTAEDTGVMVACAVYTTREDGMAAPLYISQDGLASNAELLHSVESTMERGFSTNSRLTLDGRAASLSAVPVRQAGEMTAVLAFVVTETGGPWWNTEWLGLFLGCGVLIFVLCVLALTMLIRHTLRPIGSLAEQMDRLAIGDTNLDEIKCADDELGRLWRSLQELAVGMAIRDYEMNMTLASCQRFVPQGLERLLGRGTITEVSCGDLTAADGAIGLITVAGAARMRAALDDKAFMDYVNRCFRAISSNIRPQGGVLLTSGFDLNAIRVLFTEEPDKGVHALVNLLGENAAVEGAQDCFALLHNARFLYGVAGAEDEAFPYLASAEVSFFTGKLAQLAETGCRLVVTDAFLETLTERFSTRYIGFFSSSEDKGMCKLYEVLDCYGELERAKREQYDPRLQEAIRCFYQNDFYLARNLFLAILRLCPEDGIARWYLFACEHYFNAGVGEEACYDLFGISH